MRNARPVPFFAGVLFGVGLGVAGMTDTGKVIGFLDLFGRWDASLALVMAAAIGVHLPLLRLTGRRVVPAGGAACGDSGGPPADPGLLAGAALFGVGWGLAGYCPGPAVVSLVASGPKALVFVTFMLLGSLATNPARSGTASDRSGRRGCRARSARRPGS